LITAKEKEAKLNKIINPPEKILKVAKII